MIPIGEGTISRILAKAEKQIARYPVVSFDVFDTLLARDCTEPADVFDLVEKKYNETGHYSPLSGFREMRRNAEKACAEKYFAPTLEQIYEFLPVGKDEIELLRSLEVDCERSVSTVKYTGYRLYGIAKEQSKRIIAVSDMYLGEAVIQDMLARAGYEVDAVVVSCDYHAEKYNGKLFHVAMEEMAVSGKDMIHFGDNPVADWLGARRAGVASMWIPARAHLAYFKRCGDPFCDRVLYPFVANRTAIQEEKTQALGYETCGPMLIGFCQWLHEKLHDGGYQKALFCARDMKQTRDVYLQMYPEDKDIASYFYASRKSLTLPYLAATGEDRSEEAAQQLELLLAYLEQLGCSGKVALIDSGLNGRSQKMLYEIIRDRFELHGMYIRVSNVFSRNVQDKETAVFMYPDKPEIKHMISSMFFETMLAAVHGRTVRYEKMPDGSISPVMGSGHPEPTLIEQFQRGAGMFASDYLRSGLKTNPIPAAAVQDVMLRLAFFPQKQDVELLEDLKCGNQKYEHLLIHRERGHYWIHPMDVFRDLKDTYWKGGLLRNCFSWMSPLAASVYLWADCMILEHIGEWKNPKEPE